jgi:hypothetical protein
VGTSRGVYVSTNVGTSFPGTWRATNLTSPAIASMDADKNSTPPVDYAGTYAEGIFESTDNFNTFISSNIQLPGITGGAIDHDNSTPTHSTIYAGFNSLQQAYVYENTAGYNGTFVVTTLTDQPGAIRGLKSPLAGESLEFHPVVTEFNPGTGLIFSTYLASSSWDTPGGIAIDPTGSDIYVAGTTYGADFPIAGPTPAGTGYDGFSNGFVSKIGPPPAATATATGTPGPTSSATPTATATPNGAKISAPSKVTVKPVGIGIGASSTAKVIIKNIGNTGGLIGNISLTNNQAGTAFVLSSPGPFDIAAHGSLTETVTFTPDATLDGATLSITSNDPTKGVINLNLTGTGLPGKLSVPKTLTITSKGGAPGMADLVLKNVGKGILMGSVSAATAPFSGGGGGGAIQPGKPISPPLVITFTPVMGASATSSVTITVDPPSSGSTTVTLKGVVKK